MAKIYMFLICAIGVKSALQELIPEEVVSLLEDSPNSDSTSNDTLLRLLLDPDKGNRSKSEAYDLLHSREPDILSDQPAFPMVTETTQLASKVTADQQAELIQVPGENVEKDIRSRLWNAASESPAAAGSSTVYQSFIAIIMIGLTCAMVLALYVILLSYKRSELSRPGMRHQRLEDEENLTDIRLEL